jgi:hypothetical protein
VWGVLCGGVGKKKGLVSLKFRKKKSRNSRLNRSLILKDPR